MITDDDLKSMQQSNQNKNTRNQDEKWERVFKLFLKENDIDEDFYAFDTKTLSTWLSKLWFGARQDNTRYKKEKSDESDEPKRYRANNLRAMRYSINRLLKKKGKQFDVTTSDEFIPCQLAFEDAMKELKSLGLGYVLNHIEVAPDGKIYFNSSNILLSQSEINKKCHRSRPSVQILLPSHTLCNA